MEDGDEKSVGIQTADVCASFLVVFPLVVTYWRGTWDLWDVYCRLDCPRPGQDAGCSERTGNWLSLGLGAGICVLLNSAAPFLDASIQRRRPLAYHACTRVYMYVYAFAVLGQWRGVWNLIDEYSDYEWRTNLAGFFVCVGLTSVLRINGLWTSSPWGISNDMDRDLLVIKTLMRSKPAPSLWTYFLDVALSQLLAVTLVAATWRCFWNCLDAGVLRDQPDLSAGVTLAAGTAWLLLLYAAHLPLSRRLAAVDVWFGRLAGESLTYVLVNIGVLCMWRGFWNLLATHLLPDSEVGGWTCHVVGTSGLLLLQSFRTTFDNSVWRDGEIGSGGVKADMTFVGKFVDCHESKRRHVTVQNGGCGSEHNITEIRTQRTSEDIISNFIQEKL